MTGFDALVFNSFVPGEHESVATAYQRSILTLSVFIQISQRLVRMGYLVCRDGFYLREVSAVAPVSNYRSSAEAAE